MQGLGDLVRSCIADGRLRPPTATATMDPTPRLRGNVPKTIFQHFFCRGCGKVVRPDARRCVCGATWEWDEARPPNSPALVEHGAARGGAEPEHVEPSAFGAGAEPKRVRAPRPPVPDAPRGSKEDTSG